MNTCVNNVKSCIKGEAKSSSLRFYAIFTKRRRIFNKHFARILYVRIYAIRSTIKSLTVRDEIKKFLAST